MIDIKGNYVAVFYAYSHFSLDPTYNLQFF